MRLFVELFVADLRRSRWFYTEVIGLEVVREQADFILLARDGLELHLALGSDCPEPVRVGLPGVPMGTRIELCFEVPDLDAAYARVLALGYPLVEPRRRQPWRKDDFRLVDPDGAYLRITTPELPAVTGNASTPLAG